MNEKNFVGLATDGDYVTCGSENNGLYVYYKVNLSQFKKVTLPINFAIAGALETSFPVQVRRRPLIPGPRPQGGRRERVRVRRLLEGKQQRDGGRQQPGNHQSSGTCLEIAFKASLLFSTAVDQAYKINFVNFFHHPSDVRKQLF